MRQLAIGARQSAGRLLRVAAVAAGLACPSAAVRAQGDAAAARLEAAELSVRLATLGRRTESPTALVAAAQLALDFPVRRLDAQPTGDSTLVRAAPDLPSMEVTAWLDWASALAERDTLLGSLISRLRRRVASEGRGAVNGPQVGRYQLPALGKHEFRLAFAPNVRAAVRVRVSGDATVDCEVLDAAGAALGSDHDTRSCLVNFTPTRADPIRLIVRNRTSIASAYLLMTN